MMRRKQSVWADIADVLAIFPAMALLAFRVVERVFIFGILAVILLLLYSAGAFANGGWLKVLGVGVAIWVLTVIFKDEKERNDGNDRDRR